MSARYFFTQKNKKQKGSYSEPPRHDIGIIGDFTVKCRGERLTFIMKTGSGSLHSLNLFIL